MLCPTGIGIAFTNKQLVYQEGGLLFLCFGVFCQLVQQVYQSSLAIVWPGFPSGLIDLRLFWVGFIS